MSRAISVCASRRVEASTVHTSLALGNLDGILSRISGGARMKNCLPWRSRASQKVNCTPLFSQARRPPQDRRVPPTAGFGCGRAATLGQSQWSFLDPWEGRSPTLSDRRHRSTNELTYASVCWMTRAAIVMARAVRTLDRGDEASPRSRFSLALDRGSDCMSYEPSGHQIRSRRGC